MVVLLVLFGAWLILKGIGALGVPALATWHDSLRYALAIMFVFTGVAHFNKIRHDLARMIPSSFPQPMLIVYITGVCEFLGAAGLLIPRFRSLAGICLTLLLIGMFAANSQRCFEGSDVSRQARDPALAADTDANPLHRPDLVGFELEAIP